MIHATSPTWSSSVRESKAADLSAGDDGHTRHQSTWLLAIAGLAIGIFALDLSLPLGVACGVMYLVPAALTLWKGDFRTSVATAVGCAGLTAAGYFLSANAAEPTWMVLLNRGYSVLALGLIVAVAGFQTRLDRTNEKLRSHSESMRRLIAISRQLLTSFDLRSIQRTTVETASDLFDADGAGLAIHDPDEAAWRWELLTDRGEVQSLELPDADDRGLERRLAETDDSWLVWRADRRDGSGDLPPLLQETVLRESGLRSALVVPVDQSADVTGALMIGYSQDREFEERDRLLLDAFAHVVALAVHISALYDEVGSASARRERRHIAHEVHDGFAQSFGYMLMRVGTIRRLLDRGELAEADEAVAGLETLVEDAGDDVRTFIRRLRDDERNEPDLLRSPTKIVRRAARRHDVDAELSTPDEELSPLAAPVEIQSARVLDECFRNVRQHASAPRADVRLSETDDHLRIDIANEGGPSGDPEDSSHFGLDIVRERTASLGGEFAFESDGERTLVTLELPLEPPTQP